MAQHQSSTRGTDSGMVRGERMLSAVFMIAALAYVVIGLLRGFGFVGPEGIDLPVMENAEFGGLQAAVSPDFWEAIVWISTGIASGILAWTFASGRTRPKADTAQTMRWSAYAMAVVTLAFILLAYFVGFGLINENSVPTDGVLWGTSAIVMAALTAALYSMIPQPLADEDYLVGLLQSRTGRTEATGTSESARQEMGG